MERKRENFAFWALYIHCHTGQEKEYQITTMYLNCQNAISISERLFRSLWSTMTLVKRGCKASSAQPDNTLLLFHFLFFPIGHDLK